MRILITGGPTRAYLDKVRFLSNLSTGGLAYELARELKARGAEICLVVGPSAMPFEQLQLNSLTRIETTDEMHHSVMKACRTFRPDFAIFSAAVLDFTPVKRLRGKVSSSKKRWLVALKPTPKIIDDVGEKFPRIRRIGFKLEPSRLTSAKLKKFGNDIIRRKKLDALCVNFVPEVDLSKHRATFFLSDGRYREFSTKAEIARGISDFCYGKTEQALK